MRDIDLGILTNVDVHLLDLGHLTHQLQKALDTDNIDLVVLNDAYKRNLRFAFNVVSNCRVIFCRNEKVLVDSKRNTFLYYFDMQYVQDRLMIHFAAGKFGQRNYLG